MKAIRYTNMRDLLKDLKKGKLKDKLIWLDERKQSSQEKK